MSTGYFSRKRADMQSVRQRRGYFPADWAGGGALVKGFIVWFISLMLLLSLGCFSISAYAGTVVTIQGTKFNDLNNNGIQDANEKGIAGETINIRNNTLVDAGKSGFYTGTTDVNGHYSVTGLESGNYTIWSGLKSMWQTTPVKSMTVGVAKNYSAMIPPAGTEVLNGSYVATVDFGLWDGVMLVPCTLCVVANDQQTDASEPVRVGGLVIDNSPEGGDLTITVEAFGFSTAKVIPVGERIAGASIPAVLSLSFPKGGSYPVKVTAKTDSGTPVENIGTITVRDVVTSDACDMSVQTVWSTRSGNWDDPAVWTGGRVPQPNDWVMVHSNHTVKMPAITKAQLKNAETLKVKGLCIDKNARVGNFFYRNLSTPVGLSADYQVLKPSLLRSKEDCRFDMTNAKIAQSPCRWNDANSWLPAGVPGESNNVYIPSGVSCAVEYSTLSSPKVTPVNNLCNEGLIITPSESAPADGQSYVLLLDAANIHNRGTIAATDGNKDVRGTGVVIGKDFSPNVINEGTIQSGSGAPGGRTDSQYDNGQDAGDILINAANYFGAGAIIPGNGAGCDPLVGCTKNPAVGGKGGTLRIPATGEVTSDEAVGGSSGGKTYHNGGVRGGGESGNVIVNGQDVLVNGKPFNEAEWVASHTGVTWYDPIHITVGVDARIYDKEIYFVTDENGKIEFGDLAEGAISADEVITISLGNCTGLRTSSNDCSVDLSQVSNKAFKAPKVIINADNIILPPGKTLEQLFDTPNVIVGPAKLLTRAAWTNQDEKILGKPGESMLLPLTLNNLGPATDTYSLNVTNEQGWPLCKLPSSVTVNSQRNVDLECKVTFPNQLDAENLVTVTATSQIDPSLQLVTKLRLKVANEQQPVEDAERGVTIEDNQMTVVSTETGVTVFDSGDPSLPENMAHVMIGRTLTADGQPSIVNGEVKPNGEVVFSDPQDNGSIQVAVSPEGGLVGTDADNPQHQVIVTPEGQVTATDSSAPDIVVTMNTDGSLTGRDAVSGTEVTVSRQGQQVVTHPDFPGMQATVNADGMLTVTDASDPDAAGIAAVFDLQTGNYQVVNTADGTCYSEDSNLRKSFWKKVAGFISNAAGFVARVANAITPITNVIGKVASTIGTVIGFVAKFVPLSGFWSGVLTTTKVITAITGAIPKIANVAQKISDWFGKWRRGLREGERPFTPTCETWRPTKEITEGEVLYKIYGNLLDKRGNTIPGVVVKACDKQAVPDEQGYWEIDGLSEGQCVVTAEKSGLFFVPQEVNLGNQEKVEVKLESVTDSKLKVTVNPRIPNQGDNVNYLLEILNGSTQDVDTITLTDILPVNAGLLNFTAEGMACEAKNDATFECTADRLAAGTKATVSFNISNVLADPLTNKATLTSPQLQKPEVVATVTKVRPHLAAICKTKPSPAIMGGNLAYECGIQLGPNAPEPVATNVVFSLRLPEGMITTGVSEFCTSANDGTVSCNLGTVEKGQSAKVVINTNLGEAQILQLTTETKVVASNYPEAKDVVRTNVLLGDKKADVIILLDTTGSMGDELAAVIKAIKNLDVNLGFDIVLVSFRDDVKLELFTNNREELVTTLEKLKANGGGECPEASAEALELALDHIKPNGIIILATDAPPYPGTNIEKLKAKIVEKQAVFIPILTKSNCAANELATQ